MYGDFARVTFAPTKHYSAVLKQQGRVELESDANENTSILLYHLRALARDLIGRHGGPTDGAGFEIIADRDDAGRLEDLRIAPGHYYVDGILVEAEAEDERGDPVAIHYYDQPHAFRDQERADHRLPDPPFVAYLKVWEQHVNAVQDPEIREVALGMHGPDTTSRSRIVWQVLFATEFPDGSDFAHDVSRGEIEAAWDGWVGQWQPIERGRLKAVGRRPADAEADACITAPEARYRGAENQLYRVEIHTGGAAGTATFKWSRNNGADTFPVDRLSGDQVQLFALGRDARTALRVGDWVEVMDDRYELLNEPEPLRQVIDVGPIERWVRLDATPSDGIGSDEALHPFLRRWDQAGGDTRRGGLTIDAGDNAAQIVEANGTDAWLQLEDGIQVQFQDGGTYRRGDHWLIPARVETGDVEWPGPSDDPYARGPHGVEYHFAPLALVRDLDVVDLRCLFTQLGCSGGY